MEYARFVVIGMELQSQHYATQRVLFVDTVVMDRSSTQLPSVVYQLKDIKDIMTGFEGHLLERDSLVFLGPVNSVCHQSRQLHLIDKTIINYKRLVTFSGPRQEGGKLLDHLSNGAFQTILHAIRFYEIRSAVIPTITRTAHIEPLPYCNKLTLPPTSIVGSSHLFPESRLKDIEAATQASSHTPGLRVGCRLYQVHT